MVFYSHDFYPRHKRNLGVQRPSTVITEVRLKSLFVFLAFVIVCQLSGCVSDKVADPAVLSFHQQAPCGQGAQLKIDTENRNVDQVLRHNKPVPSSVTVVSGAETIIDPNTGQKAVLASGDPHPEERSITMAEAWQKILSALGAFSAMFRFEGCICDKEDEQSNLASYQQFLADQGPQRRADTEGRDLERPLRLLKPAAPPSQVVSGVANVTDPNTGRKTVLASGDARSGLPSPPIGALPELTMVRDPSTGRKTVQLTIEHALARALAQSPEIRVISFDPSIAKQDITRAAAAFDFTAFGRVNYEQEDIPPNSIYQPGQSDVRAYETGIKQIGVTGAEWSLSYGLTRSWDDLAGRTLSTRFEPVLAFQLRQPLLRDAWEEVTLSGVNIARLNYKIALLGFREKTEDIAARVVSAYWGLVQARRDTEIQQELLDRTLDTLNKVEGRREIDATDVQIKQTESFVKIRQAALLHTRKAILDAQEELIRLMADRQLNVIDEVEIIPVDEMSLEVRMYEPAEVLEMAMRKNPVIQQARMGVNIAEINIRVAQNRKMPRLDLIASARTQALHPDEDTSHDEFKTGDYASYAIGLSLEYPLGNRQREAEFIQRRLERRKAITALQNVADQVAIAAKEGLRRIKTNRSEIQIQKEAVEAARIHLQTLKDTEPIREQLTPEFLLVTLQAQETLANVQRAENRAVADYNISLVQLARTLGTVLELHQIRSSMPVTGED